jgi:hypothetical protein
VTSSNDRLTEAQIDEIERVVLTPHRQVTLPTMHARQMIEEIRDLRDEVCLLQMKVDGGKAIVDAIQAAARTDVDTKLSAIQIERPNGPPFHLIDALIPGSRS